MAFRHPSCTWNCRYVLCTSFCRVHLSLSDPLVPIICRSLQDLPLHDAHILHQPQLAHVQTVTLNECSIPEITSLLSRMHGLRSLTISMCRIYSHASNMEDMTLAATTIMSTVIAPVKALSLMVGACTPHPFP
jgi:hypothetical protein